jgi:hypothetical protein
LTASTRLGTNAAVRHPIRCTPLAAVVVLLLAPTVLAQQALASAKADTQPTVSASLQDAQTAPDECGRWFVGFNVFPLSTDHVFGAGIEGGWTRDFYALTFRESFLTSANYRLSDTVLERVDHRFSFELTADAVLRWGSSVLFAGVGGGFRDDKLVRTQLVSGRFQEDDKRKGSVAPVLMLGVVGKLVEANIAAYFDDEIDLRMGLGITLGR